MNYYGHKGLDKFLYQKYLVNKVGGLSIEAGATDGISLSTCKTLEEIGWKCVNIEPNPVEFAKLIVNRPLSINLNVGLSYEDGVSLFDASKRPKNGHLVGVRGPTPYFQVANPRNPGQRGGSYKFEVKTVTYKTLISDLKIDRVDLFVLDVEGWEPNVIEGMKNCAVLPDIFCVEVSKEINAIINHEQLIEKMFDGLYKKDGSCWANDIYIKA